VARRRCGPPASCARRKLNEEHGYVAVGGSDELELGRQIRIVPNHACVAVNLFEELVGVGTVGSS
jgi:D-serine deaminase-like pyridoxal phosphate-dependent protein